MNFADNKAKWQLTIRLNFVLQSWAIDYPIKFYEQIKEQFPLSETVLENATNIDFNDSGELVIKQGVNKHILKCSKSDKSSFVLLDNSLLTFTLQQEQDFENIIATINFLKEAYHSVTGSDTFTSIDISYNYKVNVGERHNYNNLSHYFNYKPVIMEQYAEQMYGTLLISEYKLNESDTMTLRLSTLLPDNMPAPVLLEIIIVNRQTDNLQLNDWLYKAMEHIQNVKSFAIK